MTDQSSQFPRFYVTAASPCPYLPDLMERKVFTELNGQNPDGLHDSLTQVGFRRSQDIVYRPTCETCNRCISVRIPVQKFTANRTQKRILKYNNDVKVSVIPNRVTDEQYDLLRLYLKERHPEGGMAEMSPDEYREMVESSPVHTHLVEYRLPAEGSGEKGRLIGVALTDELKDGLSMVYSFFDTDESMLKRSLGTFAIMSHIALAREHFLGYIYLGYWVKNSPKMAYKQNFKPLELLGPGGWTLKR
ncbi:arginyltransferase [Emcibacter sp.]|uniref:arginyltransferase n=1 Tax=Emcibacter sp. TaxID=1979954 RepID=UPI003A8DBB1D